MITKTIYMKVQDLLELKVQDLLRSYDFIETGLLVNVMRNMTMDKYHNGIPQNMLYGYYVDTDQTGTTENNKLVISSNSIIKPLLKEINDAYEAQAFEPTNKQAIERLNKIVDYELEICILLQDKPEDQQKFFFITSVPTVNQKVKPLANEHYRKT